MRPTADINGIEQPARVTRWAVTTFVVLFAMNLLDYLDRNILMSMKPQIASQIRMTDAQWGLLTSFFLVSYSLVSPAMGWLGDRYRRGRLLAIGVGLWSVATVGSGLAQSYHQLALARSLLGIGEATYGVIAPTILLDLFSREQRARLMSGFYLAMPLGSALGMGLGAYIAKHHGWHVAFFLVGAPGFAAALLALFLPEPVRGASEKVDVERLVEHERAGATREDYIDMMVNSSYTYSVFGMATYTFAIGGLLVWIPNYLFETRGIEQSRAGMMLGLVTLVAAILGMSVGGWVADRLALKKPEALFFVPGVAMLGSIPFVVLGLLATSEPLIYAAIFAAETLMFINTGPCNAIIANVVQPNLRAAAYAIAIFGIHFLGDIWSPYLIGKAADWFGDPLMMQSSVGLVLARIGATPTQVSGHAPQNLVAGLLCVVPALLLSSIVLLSGVRHLPREMALMQAKLKAAPHHKV
ncbi:MAG: MFS transporter [Isosphaeraceae bacterium]|nr:MFS transporter [Isosphaeraceae bacterium]